MGKWWSSWSWGSGKLPSSCLIQIIPALYNLSSGTSFSILPAKKKESLSLSSREKFSIKVSFLLKIFLASPTLYLILGSLRSWSLCVHSTYLSSILFSSGFPWENNPDPAQLHCIHGDPNLECHLCWILSRTLFMIPWDLRSSIKRKESSPNHECFWSKEDNCDCWVVEEEYL